MNLEGDRGQRGADGQGTSPQEAPRYSWKPAVRSDQPPGEEVVQVNDAYAGTGPPPGDELHWSHEQHPTGG
jgi:hypothetical protein